MVEKEILRDVQSFIEKIKNRINIDSAWLFGSCVKGLRKEYSDIDVALVSKDFEGFAFSDNEKVLDNVENINRMIEPHPFRTSDFTVKNPFAEEIVRTGLKLI